MHELPSQERHELHKPQVHSRLRVLNCHELTLLQHRPTDETMAHERVMRPWILADLDDGGDVNVTAARNVTVSIFRTFIELKN